MAHARTDMAVVYPERIGDGRLRTVIDYLRTWLFGQLETTQDQHDREGPRQRAKRWGGALHFTVHKPVGPPLSSRRIIHLRSVCRDQIPVR